MLAAGALIAAGAAHTPSLLPESIRPAPGWLQGAFGAVHLDLHVAGTIATLTLMFGAYALVVHRATEINPRTVMIAVVVLDLLMLLAPPLVSTDVFSYQAYGRMGAHYGVDPYLNGPIAIRLDPIFPYVGAKWSSIPTTYGPVFTAAGYLLAPLGVASSVIAYKSIATAAGLGVVSLVRRCARLRKLDPSRAIAVVGLNPLFAVYGIGGGHNDLLMLLAVAAALTALIERRDAGGGLSSLLAAGIKLTGGLLLLFALADRTAPHNTSGRRNLLLGSVAGLALITGLSVAVFGTGPLHLFSTIGRAQSAGDWLSISGALREKLGLQLIGRAVGDALIGGFGLVCVGLLVCVRRGVIDWIDGAGWATLAMLVASSALLPWYVAWALPLVALSRGARLRAAALWLSGIVLGVELLGSIPHG